MAGIHCPACHPGYINSLNSALPRPGARTAGAHELPAPVPSGLGYADLPGQVQGTLCHSGCTTRVAHAQQSVKGDASRTIRVVQHVEEVEVELKVRPLPLLSCFHYFSTGCGLMDQSAELGRRRLALSGALAREDPIWHGQRSWKTLLNFSRHRASAFDPDPQKSVKISKSVLGRE